VGFRRAQNVKRQTLRRLLPNARQALEFVDEFRYGFGVVEHGLIADCEFRIADFKEPGSELMFLGCSVLNSAIRNPNFAIKKGFPVPAAASIPGCSSWLRRICDSLR